MRRLLLLLALCAPAFGQMTCTDVTASRALSTTYQNLTGRLLLEAITVQNAGGGNVTSIGQVDSVTPPVLTVTESNQGNPATVGYNSGIVYLVPPNDYHEVTTSGGTTVTLSQWVECELTSIAASTQTDVTATRVIGTIYTNSSNNLVWVEAWGAPGGATCQAFSDSSGTPTTLVGEETGTTVPLFFIVLPGYSYKITGANCSSGKWVENTTINPNVSQNIVTASRQGFQVGQEFDYQSLGAATILSASLSTSTLGSSSPAIGVQSTVPISNGFIHKSYLANSIGTLIGAVPLNYFYTATSDASGTLLNWVEWRFPSSGVFTFFGEKRHSHVN